MIKDEYVNVMTKMESVLDFPWDDLEFYSRWLSQTYFYTRQSTRLLLMASACMPLEFQALHLRFGQHAGEEGGHEILARRDLAAMGFEPEAHGEFAETKAFYGLQFYQVQHKSAPSLMGWVLPLEGLAIQYGRQIKCKVDQCPQKVSTRFLDVHVEEDEGHMESAFKALKTIPEQYHSAICENMAVTVSLYLQVLEKCAQEASVSLNERNVA